MTTDTQREMSNTKQELKPCPFCGSEASIDRDSFGPSDTLYYYAECHGSEVHTGKKSGSKKRAIDYWNSRAPDSSGVQEGLFRKIKDALNAIQECESVIGTIDGQEMEVDRVLHMSSVCKVLDEVFDSLPSSPVQEGLREWIQNRRDEYNRDSQRNRHSAIRATTLNGVLIHLNSLPSSPVQEQPSEMKDIVDGLHDAITIIEAGIESGDVHASSGKTIDDINSAILLLDTPPESDQNLPHLDTSEVESSQPESDSTEEKEVITFEQFMDEAVMTVNIKRHWDMEAQLKLGRSLSPAQPTEGLTVERVERLFDQNSIVNASEDTPVLMREDFIAIIAELKETP